MTDRLIGCLIKLDRALTHLKALNEAIEGFKESQIERIPGKFDVESGKYFFRSEGRAVPKREWSGIIGDVLHNLRAALDYLAWELVDSHSPGSGTTRTEFPIFLDRDKFKRSAPSKTKGMAPDAIALIKRLQPFSDSPALRHPSENPLWILQSLVTSDKHRTLTLTAEAIEWHWEGLPADVHAVPSSLLHENDTATVATFDPGPNPERYVNVEFVTTSNICFSPSGPGDGEPVMDTLRDISTHIRDSIIPRLRGFLS